MSLKRTLSTISVNIITSMQYQSGVVKVIDALKGLFAFLWSSSGEMDISCRGKAQ